MQTFSRLDVGFAEFLAKRSQLQNEQRHAFENLIKKLSSQQSLGHSCIFLNGEEQVLINNSGLASQNQLTPLIIEQNRLYLHRYWHYEQRLAKQLIALSQQQQETSKDSDNLLDLYFPKQSQEIDWQKQAAKQAINQALTIITGGPGTGKTTTVVKILALLQEIAELPLHIALAAPTGKAAMRLQEAIAANKFNLPCSEEIRARIPEKVSTLHRLLGAKPPTPYFKHSAEQPLPYDIVVIDECSMIDLALMSKLVDALKPEARLILLGDKDQLASVEAGAVLADITQSLPTHTIELKKSHRFQGSIKALADAVNLQQAALAWQLLKQNLPEAGLLSESVIEFIVNHYLDYLELITKGADFLSIYQAFNRFKVLCANHQGRHSVAEVNHQVEQRLSKLNKISLNGLWYAGRPVMITTNNPTLQLFNGDIGLCVPDEDGQLQVGFVSSDGSVRMIQTSRLTEVETVFAMTIHKSQGSEFDRILIMLPEHYNPVLSKELIYTAITRAKLQVKVVCSQAIWLRCVEHKIQRQSGLAAQLQTLALTDKS